MTAGPKLRAGFVLVPEISASSGIMIAYRTGKMAGVYARISLNPMNIISNETMVNVVITSPSNASSTEKPSPGIVTPNDTLLPSWPQISKGSVPITAPVN